MPDHAFQDRVNKLDLKAARRADAAYGRKCAAEHGAAVGKALIAETARNQFPNRQHGVERAFLVKHARAVDPGERAQDHLVPVADDILEFPQHRPDRLVAHLLRPPDTIRFDLAGGVIRADADNTSAPPATPHPFHPPPPLIPTPLTP